MKKQYLLAFSSIFLMTMAYGDIKDGLRFYIPFENNCGPAIASGARVAEHQGVEFVDGPNGKAVKVEHGIKYQAGANFNASCGTVAFWFMPGWDTASKSGPVRELFSAVHIKTAFYPSNGNMFFMTGKTFPQEGFKWDYANSTRLLTTWQYDQWHHIAIAWDAAKGKKSLYIDGTLVKANSTPIMSELIAPGSIMGLGLNTPGKYDELLIWSRELSLNEIGDIYAHPEKTAAEITSLCLNQDKVAVVTAKNINKTDSTLAETVKIGRSIIPVEKTIVKPCEIFEAEIPVSVSGLKAYQGKIIAVLRDFWMNDCGRQELELSLASGQTKIYKLPFTAARKGIYKIELNYVINGKKVVKDVASFACWSNPSAPDPDSFFGNHVNSWAGGRYIGQAHRLGLTWMRNHNMLQTTWWINAQPESGTFIWRDSDQLDHLKKYNIPVLGQFFTTPYWAASGGVQQKIPGYSQCWAPDMNLFSEYVYQTVKHYADYIKYWEIWNEPEVGRFWKGTPEKFGELVQTAVKAAKKADPACKIMSAGFTAPPWLWHEKSAKAGAFKGIDLIAFHYGCPVAEPEDTYARLQAVTDHFQEMAVKYGDGHKLPLWDTEGGTDDTTFLRGLESPKLPPEAERQPMNWHEGAIACVRGEAVHMALGIKKHFIYLQNPIPESSADAYINTSMLDVNNAPRPKLMARVVMQEQLDWTVFSKMVRRKEGRFWANIHQKKQSPDSVALLWCGAKGELRLRATWPGKITKAVDIMGNDFAVDVSAIKITGEPFYLHIAASAEKVADAIERAAVTVVAEPEKLEIADDGSEHKIPILPDFVAPGENPAGNFTIDLRTFCNMNFADDEPGNGKGGWSDEGGLNDLRDFKSGKRKFCGVTFDIIDPQQNDGRAVITLYGSGATAKMPDAVRNIPVNRKARTLYFLHAAAWGAPGDIGEYMVNFADGTSEPVMINIPQNSNNWWFGYDKKELSHPVPVLVSNTATGKPAWRYLRVFEWENRAGKIVKSIDFFSLKKSPTPILIAISGACW